MNYFRLKKLPVLFLVCIFVNAKGQSVATDTLAFRQYLSNNIGTALNVKNVIEAYRRLKSERDPYNDFAISFTTRDPSSFYFSETPMHGGHSYKSLSGKTYFGDVVDDGFLFNGRAENKRFPDSLRFAFRENARNYRTGISSIKEEKNRLVRNLTAFDSAANNKPIFFATIYSTYKGDIKAYVDDLYKKSIMGNKWRLNTFLRWPSAKKLQKDMSVQFAIGLALYELWIKDVREGKVTEGASKEETE